MQYNTGYVHSMRIDSVDFPVRELYVVPGRFREGSIMTLLGKGVSSNAASHEVGFGSRNYFVKAFKRLTGMTPTEYHELRHPA